MLIFYHLLSCKGQVWSLDVVLSEVEILGASE